MSCLSVRERLAEHALDVLPATDATTVDRHLEWCAACRKEAGELRRAAATLAYSVAPVAPPARLEGAVVEAVKGVARRRGSAPPRLRRGAVAAVLAAMLALSGLGWGAVMAGRSERLREQITAVREARERSIRNFRGLIQDLEGADPKNIVELATLLSPRQRAGTGEALVLLSPSSDDLVLVVLGGLADVRDEQLPLEVRLISERSGELIVGPVRALDSGGGGGVSRWFVEDLRAFHAIVVRDAAGKVLLNGTLSVYEPGA